MPLTLEELSFQTLDMLDDGKAVNQFMILLRQALSDIKSRPGEERARKVLLQLDLTPKTVIDRNDELGSTETILTGVGLEIKMDVKTPNRKTLKYDMGISGDRLVFNPNSPFEHRQPTLFNDKGAIDAKSAAVGS